MVIDPARRTPPRAALNDRTQPPWLMGILNITPDSFSDGGKFSQTATALAHARAMVSDGAAIIDVGGESTRPGAGPVPDEIQLARVLPAIEALRQTLPDTLLSIDTRSPRVAQRAVTHGVGVINDVTAARAPGMLEVAAGSDAVLVLMHMQGTPETMQAAPHYADVVGEVLEFLLARAAAAEQAGITRARIVLDPGIGFGKTRAQNLQLLAALPRFVATGYSIMLGTSRKRFMGAICRETESSELVGATCATTALGTAAGVRIFRVHDVKPNRQAMEVAWALKHSP